MTKIQAEYKQDVINRNGRSIGIKWITDNDVVNSYLKLPRMFNKQYETNVAIDTIQQDFEAEAVPLVQEAETNMNKSMSGQSFEVDV